MKDELVLERFLKFVSPEPMSGCWLWLGVVTVRIPKPSLLGYGRFTICGIKIVAHRASWLIFKGPIPEDLFVLHKCDTPLCVNPDHLFLGTKSDNVNDAVTKGRWLQFKKPWKLEAHEVIAIKSLRGDLSQYQLAKRFNISQSYVGILQRNQGWI